MKSRGKILPVPAAPERILAGSNLALVLDEPAVTCLAHNLWVVWPDFNRRGFQKTAMAGLGEFGLMARGDFLACVLREFLPSDYHEAVRVLIDSLGPPVPETSGNGLATFFYLPHTRFVALFGVEAGGGEDPFEISMLAQHELTRRFTAEFSIRPFLVAQPERTLKRLLEWTRDPDPHVRRLCSEGSRPRLPWAMRLPAFVKDPRPTLPILEALKDDPELYVRRSVANHLGDIAKDHLDLALKIARRWTASASPERLWVVRHALRHPAKKGHPEALDARRSATAPRRA